MVILTVSQGRWYGTVEEPFPLYAATVIWIFLREQKCFWPHTGAVVSLYPGVATGFTRQILTYPMGMLKNPFPCQSRYRNCDFRARDKWRHEDLTKIRGNILRALAATETPTQCIPTHDVAVSITNPTFSLSANLSRRLANQDFPSKETCDAIKDMNYVYSRTWTMCMPFFASKGYSEKFRFDIATKLLVRVGKVLSLSFLSARFVKSILQVNKRFCMNAPTFTLAT